MRAIRLMIAVLIAVILAAAPVTASLAKDTAKAEMSMSSADSSCPCCDATKKCATDICTLKCYTAAAIRVEEQSLAEPLPSLIVGMGVAAMSPFAQGPDPPPPRS